MQFQLNIQTLNVAMEDPEAVAKVLEDVAAKLRAEGIDGGRQAVGHVRDPNGNKVGTWLYVSGLKVGE